MIKLKNRAIFLDRDGVINFDRDDYVKSIDELILIPNVADTLNKLKKMGYYLVIISNQSAVGRGIISKKDLEKINEYLINELQKLDCNIDGLYYCPHIPSENCECRKPKDALFRKAARELDIDLDCSWMIGDKESDSIAGQRAGCKTFRINRNGSLFEAVSYIENSGNEVK